MNRTVNRTVYCALAAIALLAYLAAVGFAAGWRAASTVPAITASSNAHPGSLNTLVACALLAGAVMYGKRRLFART